MTLETQRLLFRPHELCDLDDYCDIVGDPDVRRHVGGRPLPRAEAERRFHQIHLQAADYEIRLMATVFKPERRYIGYCGLYRGGCGEDEAVLAFYIAKPYWGRGLATEAGRAFIGHGFDQLRLNRLIASAEVDHATSIRVLEKLAFRQTGIEAGARSFIHFELLNSGRNSRALDDCTG